MASNQVNEPVVPAMKKMGVNPVLLNGLAKAPARGAELNTIEDFEGVYEVSGQSLISNAVPAEFELTVTDTTTGEVVISGFPQEFTVTGVLDVAAKTLTIANDQYLGPDSYGDDNYFYLKPVEGSSVQGGKSDAAATVGTISDEGVITFPVLDVWAIGDYNDEGLGWWMLTYAMEMTLQLPEDENADPNEGWTTVGNAKVQDGWVLPAFDVDQSEEQYLYECELQQNIENTNVYRLVNPFHGNSPLADLNEDTKGGYIQFDVTDPDHVYFEPVNSGFALSGAGINKMFCYNELTFWCLYYDMEPAGFVELVKQQDWEDLFKWTTFKDRCVTLSSVYDETNDPDTNEPIGWVNDACFGYNSQIASGTSWTNTNMEAKIYFPDYTGIESVNAVQEVQGIEYYNLQGIKVEHPSAGIYVVRQGNSTSKRLFR